MTDPLIRALSREHSASPAGYSPPEDVKAARKALRDLLARTKDRARTRDEKRLAARYTATVEAHHDALMAKHSSAAPSIENGAT